MLEELRVSIVNDDGRVRKEMESKEKEHHAPSERILSLEAYRGVKLNGNFISRKDTCGRASEKFSVPTLFWIKTRHDQTGNDIRTATTGATEPHIRKLK